MKNSADLGGCYPPRLKAEEDNTLLDLQNSKYPTKAKFNNCFIIHSKYFPVFKGVLPFRSLFFCSPKITQPYCQVFLVSGSIICSRVGVMCGRITSQLHSPVMWRNAELIAVTTNSGQEVPYSVPPLPDFSIEWIKMGLPDINQPK